MQILTKLSSLVALCLLALFAVLSILQKNNNDNTTTNQLRRGLLGTIMHPMQQQQGGLIDPQSIVYKPPSALTIATDDINGNGECCVPCTSPENTCCLYCNDVSSYREHDLLMASMEGLTTYIMDHYKDQKIAGYNFLKNRAWEGNSHIGNRPLQATYYYDWIRSLDNTHHVCEIGLNGGHSAVIFLAALAGIDDVHMTMFDLMTWEYSSTAASYVDTLYPGKMNVIEGKSQRTVKSYFAENPNDLCDFFSVDGGHRYFEAKPDIVAAAAYTRKGGVILLDDMNPGSQTRNAFDEVVEEGLLTNPHCVENVQQKVGYVNRVDETYARDTVLSWCFATVV